ncbi:MAG TPA: tRNA pseudouridine(55) synthase TruB [Saprospiraceae bacterium]|nr:tRNA pseudouridine(55) synthase TruB [Saprospiraceae bacterium]HMU02933.1 tRNA pseudouridine(55) synthase TruB [Saprospiraceae bacterium]
MSISTNQIITKSTNPADVDFQLGQVLLIDKPLEWTSFDVVNKLRFKIKHGLGVKKIKVGHAGTLDPLATGLLLICTGKLTKDIDSLQAKDKLYSGTIILGATTATYDSEVPANEHFPTDHITDVIMETARQSFIGPTDQIPPIYSAIKIDGQKAYDIARRGKDVEMKSRAITINSFNIDNRNFPILSFVVGCSKGTYIRSLAHDFGKACESGAYLGSLRREKIGDFDVKDGFTLDEAVNFIELATNKIE